MNFLRLFGWRSKTPARAVEIEQRETRAHLIAIPLVRKIEKCLALDGFESRNVPNSMPFNKPKCLATLAGLAVGLFECENVAPEDDDYFDTIETAMMLVFGRDSAYDLAADIVSKLKSGDSELNAAFEFSREDVLGAYAMNGVTTWTAYHLALHDVI